MFVCAQCGCSFKNYHEKRAHTKHCAFNINTTNAPDSPIIDIQPPLFDATNTLLSTLPDTPPDCPMQSDPQCLPYSIADQHVGLNTEENFIFNCWRGPPSSIPEPLQSSPTEMLEHEHQVARDVRKHESRQASLWTNKNYRILSQLINSLSLSQSDADRLLNAVRLIFISSYRVLPQLQIRCIDSSLSIPLTCRHLKMEEDKILGDMKMRVLDMSSEPKTPFTKNNVCMIAPDQQLSCITYDLWDTVQDLLNDGEHATHAHFVYTPNIDPQTSTPLITELWTAGWWKQQQEAVGESEKIMAIIFYVDETNVTFNGRNVHPVYVTLGNLHVEYRYVNTHYEVNIVVYTTTFIETSSAVSVCLGSFLQSECGPHLEALFSLSAIGDC